MKGLAESPAPPADRYDLIVPLWGPNFVEMFVNYCLPSQLAPGNLPSLPSDRCCYHICTTQEDAKAIWTSASVRKLRKLMDVSLVTFCEEDVRRDAGLSDYRYVKNLQKMTWCYQRVMQTCAGVDSAFIFMTPDSVWANGAFRYMDQCQRAGVRALMALGLITHREKLQHKLTAYSACDDGTVIDVGPRQLVSLSLDSLHPLAISRIMKNGGSRFCSAYYWVKPGHGLVARCFYLHPIMVRPRVHFDRLPTTVDYRYVPQAVPDPNEVHIVTDSDNLFYVDMADLHHVAAYLGLENYTRPETLDWMSDWADVCHREYFRHSIIVHESDVTDQFDEEQAEAERFAESLLADFSDHQPISGRKMYPSNLYYGDQLDAFNAPPPDHGPQASAVPESHAPSWARQVASVVLALVRRVARKCYHLFNAKLYARISEVESQLAMTEHKVRELEKYLRAFQQRLEAGPPRRTAAYLTPYLIHSEFQIRRELERLRRELDQRVNERKAFRLLGNADIPRAIG